MCNEFLTIFPGAVRFIRKIIGIKDEFYNRHIVSCHLFAPLIDAYVRNDARYNLLDSAILEIFEFIRAVCLSSDALCFVSVLITNNYLSSDPCKKW